MYTIVQKLKDSKLGPSKVLMLPCWLYRIAVKTDQCSISISTSKLYLFCPVNTRLIIGGRDNNIKVSMLWIGDRGRKYNAKYRFGGGGVSHFIEQQRQGGEVNQST